MHSPKIIQPLLTLAILVSLISCSRESTIEKEDLTQTEIKSAKPNNNPPPPPATTICNYNPDETILIAAGWTLAFKDEFNDLSNWNIWTGGAFNNELQYYQPDNLTISNGILTIAAKKENVTGATNPFDATPKNFQYTSGRIECKQTVSASTQTPKVRMVARVKLAPGYGMWPAFWSYGDPWPTQGEIDIIEARGQEPNKYQTNYFYGKTANRNIVRNATGYITADSDLTECFHVYEMIWEQNSLTSLLDGNVVEVKTSGGNIPNLFGKTERITLNLAVGGNFFNNLNPSLIQTGTMYVDYVKVFTAY